MKIICTVIFLLLPFSNGRIHVKLDNNWTTQNIFFGSLQKNFPATVLLNSGGILASVENNFLSESTTNFSDPDLKSVFYDSVNIDENKIFTAYTQNNTTKNSLNLGWFLINTIRGITVIPRSIISNVQSHWFVQKTFPLKWIDDKPCADNVEMHLPNMTKIENARICFRSASLKVALPMSFGPLDNTQLSCYGFPALADRKICTDNLDDMLTLHDHDYVEIGLNSQELFVGLTLQQEEIMAGPAWNEIPVYTNFDFLIMFFVAMYLLVWSLYFCHTNFILYRKDLKSTTTEKIPFCHVPLSSKLFFQSGVILLVGTIADETINNNFIFRLKYVIDDSLRSYVDIYLMFLCLAVLFAALVCIYNSLQLAAPENIILQRSLFETLLTVAVATIFVGRTVLCEQTIVCVLAASFWIPFQFVYLFSCKKKTAFLQIGIFLILYPFVIFSMLEPVVRDIFDLKRNSWVNSQLAILIPCIITYCYVTLLKHVSVM